ncbi:hypothetical protein SLITO_v1c06040 [Spiroplasma litorale]|uniref:Lipoprotein n=1 Tax=Spiroplasma litorale TaxID=216942 RepID=A0A0K1W237_9MOLU|nr:hypothetical protein [Spiroplasma litorale]AKX34238.1 hypothetical protein SLITO_v1c06040 [Spiroplasma litorale]
MKKLISFLASISVMATPSLVLACGGTSETEDKNKDKIDLSKIENKDLGNLNGDDKLPSLSLVIKELNKINKNLNLTENDVQFDGTQTTTSAKLKALETSTSFIGEVTLSYNYQKNLFDLSTLKNKDLGTIKGNGNLPTIKEIITSINKVNENLNLKENDVQFDGTQTTTSAKLKALETSTSFKGEVNVTYKFEKSSNKDLSTLKGDLEKLYGKDSKPTDEEIINKFILVNKEENIKSSDIKLKQNSLNEELTKATIEAAENSESFFGLIDVTFEYNKATEVDLKLVDDLIKGEGDYASFSPAVFKKGVTASSEEITSKEKMFNNVKTFTERLLKLASILGIKITFDQLKEMVDINYYSDENGTTLQNNNEKIKLIRITVKKGWEMNIEGYYVTGVINAKIYEKVDITKVVTETDLGTLKVTSTSLPLYALRAVNEYLTTKYKDYMDANNITSDCWETINNKSFKYDDNSKTSATVTLPKEDTFNNIFYNNVTLKFKIEKK